MSNCISAPDRKTSELSLDFLQERNIAWFCTAIDLLTQCHETPMTIVKQAKSIRDIARTVVTFYGRKMDRGQLSMYTQCVQVAGELVRNPHASKSNDALHQRLPKIIENMTAMAKSLRQVGFA